MIWTRARTQRAAVGTAIVVGLLIAAAAARQPDVVVVTGDPITIRPGVRGGRTAALALAPATGDTAESTCSSPQPIGTWTCQNGVWVAGIAPASNVPNGLGPGGCITPSPGVGWSCRGGTWFAPVSGDSGGERGSTGASAAESLNAADAGMPQSGALPCPVPAPDAGWTCQNGTWVASTTTPRTANPANPSPNNGCPGSPPSPNAVCRAGLWTIR